MKELRKVSQEELRGILELHKLWLESEGDEGECADLSYCDLRNTDLSYCDLTEANLTNAILSYCDLTNTNLTNADLSYTELYETNLFYAKVDNMVSVGNVGNENRTVYYFYKEDRVICECFDDTLENFKKAVIEKYGNDYGSYAIAVEVFGKMKDTK